MNRYLTVGLTAFVLSAGGFAHGDDAGNPTTVVDKALQAMGGVEKLAKIHAVQSKSKGAITIAGNENPLTAQTTVQGLSHFRLDFTGEFNGTKVEGCTIIAGDKGWRKMGGDVTPLDSDMLKGEKHNFYLSAAGSNPAVLKKDGYKLKKAFNEKMDGKAVVGVLAAGPDGKEFTLYFDKETGLPTKLVGKVMDFTGEEVDQETTYSNYKEMSGMKRATKIVSKRNGEPFLSQELIDFKILDKVDPKLFEEPK